MIVSGTGSRDLKMADKPEKARVWHVVLEHMETIKQQNPDVKIMSGLAEGFDEMLAFMAMRLNVPLIAAVPNKTYGDYYWKSVSLTGQDRTEQFNAFLEYAQQVVYVMEDVHNITKSLYLHRDNRKIHANFIRNEYMVENGDFFFVYDPESAGTKHCFRLIKQAGKPYEIVGDMNDTPQENTAPQCIALKKNGERCNNEPKHGEQMCGPHLDQAYAYWKED